MHKRRALTYFLVCCIVVILLTSIMMAMLSNGPSNKDNGSYDPGRTISIIAWNLQIFGDKKANNTELMNAYYSILKDHDVIIVQEIRDSNGDAFEKFCKMFENYTCKTSSRAGRSSSKEQYGIIYRSPMILDGTFDYNPDEYDRWERPPLRADLSKGNYSFSIYTIHTKPEDATNEIQRLEEIINNEGLERNILIIGDLNADCSYYDEANRDFSGWNWIIKNSEDTTAGNSDCAYDRIILNGEMSGEFIEYKIGKTTTTEMSDHHPVSLIIHDQDISVKSTGQGFKKFILSIMEY